MGWFISALTPSATGSSWWGIPSPCNIELFSSSSRFVHSFIYERYSVLGSEAYGISVAFNQLQTHHSSWRFTSHLVCVPLMYLKTHFTACQRLLNGLISANHSYWIRVIWSCTNHCVHHTSNSTWIWEWFHIVHLFLQFFFCSCLESEVNSQRRYEPVKWLMISFWLTAIS